MGTNEKGENWEKYLKEMQMIGPTLQENQKKTKSGIIGSTGELEPINNKFELFDKKGARIQSRDKVNRAERRRQDKEQKLFDKRLKKAGGDKEYLNKMLQLDQSKTWLKDAHRVTRHKTEKINLWFDEELRMLLGSKKYEKIKKYVDRKGKWPWWRFYIKCKIQHETAPYPWGTDNLAIYVFGQLHASITYVWENK